MVSFRLENENIFSCKFSPKTNTLFSCTSLNNSFDLGYLRIYEFQCDSFVTCLEQFSWRGGLLDCCWQDNHVITASSDGSLQLWSLSSQPRGSPQLVYLGHDGAVTCVLALPSADNIFVSGSIDGTVKNWDKSYPNSIASFKMADAVIQIAGHPSMSYLVGVVTANRKLLINDSRQPSASVAAVFPHLDHKILSCDWSPDDFGCLSVGCADGTVCWIDIRTQLCGNHVASHRGPVRRIKYIPGYKNVVISAGFDGLTAITDVMRGCVLERMMHHSNGVYDVDASRLLRGVVADCSWDSLLHIYKPRSLTSLVEESRTNKL